MLKFRVRDIPSEGLHREIPLGPAWFASALHGVDGTWDDAAGSVSVTLSRARAEILARGELAVRFHVPCARCLEPALVEVSAPFATTFVPAPVAASEGDEDEPDIQTYTGDEVDLSPLCREQVLLGIPLSALCRPDCKGLCPQCGAELNLGSCTCTPPMDPARHAPRAGSSG